MYNKKLKNKYLILPNKGMRGPGRACLGKLSVIMGN
jgi:hypothetical protein